MGVLDLLNSDDYIEDQEIVAKRKLTCARCPRLFKRTLQCKDCWCFVKAKALLRTEDCPNGYWDELPKTEQNG